MSVCDQNILNLSSSYIENIMHLNSNYHTSSVEAVHSQVIFFFYDNIQLFISFLLNFYFTFLICYCFGNKVVVKILAAVF